MNIQQVHGGDTLQINAEKNVKAKKTQRNFLHTRIVSFRKPKWLKAIWNKIKILLDAKSCL